MTSSISLTYVPLLLSLLILFSLVAPSVSNPTEKLTSETLKRVCLASGSPTCLRTLRHDPQTKTLNLRDLTLAYVTKTRNRASSTLLWIENQETLDRDLLLKYRSCWKHYKIALMALTRAKRRLESGSITGISGLATSTFTTAADCDDEFEDRKFPRPVELDTSNKELKALGGVVFGLAAELVIP